MTRRREGEERKKNREEEKKENMMEEKYRRNLESIHTNDVSAPQLETIAAMIV